MGARAAWSLWAAVAWVALSACNRGPLAPAKTVLAVEPAVLDFGPTSLAFPRTVKLTVKSQGRAPFRVLGATVSGADVTVEPFDAFELTSGAARTLEVTFAPTGEGAQEGTVALATDTSSAGPDNVAEVPFRGLGVSAYARVTPETLDFGSLELGEERALDLTAHNPTGADVAFRFVIEGDDAALFSAAEAGQDVVLAAGERRAFSVVYHADRLLAAQAELRVVACGACGEKRVELDGFGVNSLVDITPNRVDFGRVPVGARAEVTLTVTNLGTLPLDLGGFEWKGAAGPFSVDALVPTTIPAGASVETLVRFAPAAAGPVPVAFLQVKVKAGNTVAGGWPMLPVKGEVGDSCVVALPRAVDFGIVPELMTASKEVDLLNRCGRPVVVTDLAVAVDVGGFFGLAQPAQPVPLKAGAVAPVGVLFTPKPASGQSTARLLFKVSLDAATSSGEVAMKGQTVSFTPCQYVADPATLDFGAVGVGSQVTLGVAFRNTGTDDCFLSAAQLVPGSDVEFTSAGAASRLLAPGESALLPVKFAPQAVGVYSGLAEAFLNGPGGHATVPVSGRGIQGCLLLQPANLDFGVTPLSCGARTRTVNALNNCSGTVHMSSLAIGMATSTSFSVAVAPAMPFNLPPGAYTNLVVAYHPAVVGDDWGALRIDANLAAPLAVGLSGRAVADLNQSDRFFQEGQTKVDLLFVVDNSGSMVEEQAGLAQNFAAVLSAAQGSGIDYHLGVTTTGIEPAAGGWAACPGGASGGEAGRLFPADGTSPRILTPSTPNAAQVFATDVTVGFCHWDEQGLEAAYRALSAPLANEADDPTTSLVNDGNLGFLRPDAKLAVIVISDEDDSSPQPVAFYETVFKGLKGDDSQLSFSAVVGPPDLSTCPTAASSGSRYLALAQATGGITESICTQDWAASLTRLSANAFGPKARFPLSEKPGNAQQVTVQVNGLPVTSGWAYDAASNSVVFAPAAVPAAGSVVDVSYPLGC